MNGEADEKEDRSRVQVLREDKYDDDDGWMDR